MQLTTFSPPENHPERIPEIRSHNRSENRYVFCQKAQLDIAHNRLPIRTVDVSTDGFGILSPEPIRSGQACDIQFSTHLGNRIVHLHFSCTSTYCILNGLAGYRVGLSITEQSADQGASLHALIKRRATLSKTV